MATRSKRGTGQGASKGRPSRSFETGAITTWLRRGTLVLTIIISAVLLVRYPQLPDEIPTHFNFAGEADGWGSRSSVLFMIAIFVVLTLPMLWLSSRPNLFNYPFEITEGNAQAAYREGERMMVWVSFGVVALYAAIALSTAFGIEAGAMFVVPLIGLLGATVVGIFRMIKAAR